jgi:ATP-dependent RNA helicase RhlE
MLFKELEIIEPLLSALEKEGYSAPTPIQAQSIPHALKGKDILGCAQTGTGKTAAFSLPILQRLHLSKQDQKRSAIRCLILTPTRELAIQIQESMEVYGRNLSIRSGVIFGGVGQQQQTDMLRRGIDILIATPGRLLDLIQQGFIRLHQLEIFVLDEADRMLDMGFIHDVKKIVQLLPKKRQTLFFSATMPDEIQHLAYSILDEPVKVEVNPVSSTAEKIAQYVFFVDKDNKTKLLQDVLKNEDIKNVLVFSRTKHGADKIVKKIKQLGISAEAIHGNKSQTARQKALKAFKNQDLRVLVATDIAARGIDVDDLQYVINYDIPNVPETYVHRIGRTGRAGAEGISYSFCQADERPFLRSIEKLTAKKLIVVEDHNYPATELEAVPAPKKTVNPRRPAPKRRFARQS